jgi:hypothetical protein
MSHFLVTCIFLVSVATIFGLLSKKFHWTNTKIAESKQEDARRLARYDEAVRLLRECAEWSGQEDVAGLDWIDCQIDRDTIKEALAFLAAEPADKETT